MTVASTITSKQYTGTGTGSQFSFPNKVFSAGDLVITIYDTSGNAYPFVNFANATLGWTYTVQNVDVDTGCIVALSNVLTSSWVLDIRSLIPELQSTSVKNQGQFLPELHEEAFDRATRMIQDLLRLTYTYGIHGPDTEFAPWPALPAPSLRKGYALMFDGITGIPGLGFLSAQNVTQGLIAPLLNLQQTLAEIAASVIPVNFGYTSSPLDLRRYGADPTGVGFSDAAMISAIAVCGVSPALNGGRIYLPAGKYKFANPWVLTSGITLEGDGCTTGGTFPGTQVIYTGTSSAHFIQMTSLGGCALKRMQITNTGAFTGAMLGAHGSSNCTVEDVVFNATTFGCYHIELDQALQFTTNRCSFYAGAFSVNGQSSAGGSFSNVVRFDNCFWQGQAAPPINYGGQSWTFKGCTVENMSNGKAGFFGNNAVTQCYGLTITGCWFGDATVAGGVLITLVNSSGVVISGNFISGDGVTSTVGIALSGCVGVVITGNFFISLLTAINLVTATTKVLVIKGNQFATVTNPLGGAGSFGDGATSEIGPNLPQIGVAPYVAAGINGYEWSPNGILRQWGEVSFTAGSGSAVTFPIAFPHNIFNLVVGVRSGASTNSAAASSATTSGFNINSAGSGSVVIDYMATGN